MGGVAVLQPHDFLREVPRVRPNRSRAQPIPRRKRSPNTSPPSRAAAKSNINKETPNGTVDVQIRILKRGESLPETAPPPPSSPPPAVKASDLGLKRHIPKPAQPRTKPAPFYAGSACITSPPPSSLPLPAFFAKKIVDDAAVDPTRGLQRLLGLEL